MSGCFLYFFLCFFFFFLFVIFICFLYRLLFLVAPECLLLLLPFSLSPFLLLSVLPFHVVSTLYVFIHYFLCFHDSPQLCFFPRLSLLVFFHYFLLFFHDSIILIYCHHFLSVFFSSRFSLLILFFTIFFHDSLSFYLRSSYVIIPRLSSCFSLSLLPFVFNHSPFTPMCAVCLIPRFSPSDRNCWRSRMAWRRSASSTRRRWRASSPS